MSMSHKLGSFGNSSRSKIPTNPSPLHTSTRTDGEIRSSSSSVYEDDLVEHTMYEAARPAPRTPKMQPHGMVDRMMDELSGYERYLEEQEASRGLRVVVEDVSHSAQEGAGPSANVADTRELWPGYLASRSADQHPGLASPGQISLTSEYSQTAENHPPEEPPSNRDQAGYTLHVDSILHRQKSWTPSEMIEQYAHGWDRDSRTPITPQSGSKEQTMRRTDTRGFDRNPKGLHIKPQRYPLTHSRVESPGEGMPDHVRQAEIFDENSLQEQGFVHSWPPLEFELTKSSLFNGRDRQRTHGSSHNNLFPPRVASMPQKVSPREESNHRRGESENVRKQTRSPVAPLPLMAHFNLSPTYPPSIPYAATKSPDKPPTPTSAETAAALGRAIMNRGADGYWRYPVKPCKEVLERKLRPPNYLEYGEGDGGWL